jgi:hypothetical protein
LIFFIPRYDSATEANLVVAQRILPEGAYVLFADLATRAGLLNALAAQEGPLFAMAHGRPSWLLAQNGDKALGVEDIFLLAGRGAFAFACHTAGELGRVVAGVRGSWWGYTGSVMAPDVSPHFLPLFVEIFSYIRGAFAEAFSTQERMDIILQIAALCEDAQEEVAELWEADPSIDIGSALFCLLHIWQRLRVWEPGAEAPLLHPSAPPPLLL